jgi:hypothetical protein
MRSRAIAFAVVILSVASWLTGCGASGSLGGSITPPAQPTATFTSTTPTVVAGQSVTISYATTNTATCTINGIVVPCGSNESYTFAPSATEQLSLIATGASGTTPAMASLTVVVIPQPTVTISANPTTITAGQSSTLTVASTGTTSCIIAGLGTVTCNGAIAVSPTATTQYTVTANGPVGTTAASASLTVTVISVTPTITVACTPTAITTADTSRCTATYQGLGPGVNWTVVGGGSVSATGVYTPPATATGTLTATITATSTQAGNTNVSGSAQVAVTDAIPVITGSNLNSLYCDEECGIIGGISLTGSGFQVGDAISSIPSGMVGLQFVSSTQLTETLIGDTPHTSPGWIITTVTSPDGSKSGSWTIPFIGNQNLLALSANGELNFLDEGNRLLRQYKADGTPDGTGSEGSTDSNIAVDAKTGYTVLNQRTGGSSTFYVAGIEGFGNGHSGVAIAARNGFGCLTQASGVNYLSCVDLTIPPAMNPALNSNNAVGSQPWSVAMGLFGTETDAFAFSRDGTTTLWKSNVSGGNITTGSQTIPGVTPVATLQAANSFAGGWQVAVFDSGPASGTVAVLSTADMLVSFFSTSTMVMTKQVTLSGLPFRIAADLTNGNLLVAYADHARVLTTFAKINPATGVVTPLTATSSILAVGFAVKADGTSFYACQRAVCEIHPNQ